MNARTVTLLVRAVVATMTSVTGVACGDDREDSLGPQEQALYKIDSFTENRAGCEAEGASVLAEDRDHLIVFLTKDLFGQALHAHACGDPTACRSEMTARLSGGGWAVRFDVELRAREGETLTGRTITTGFSDGAICKGGELTTSALQRPADGKLRLEARTITVDHPKDKEGICWTSGTESAAAGQPCGRLRVITASRLEVL